MATVKKFPAPSLPRTHWADAFRFALIAALVTTAAGWPGWKLGGVQERILIGTAIASAAVFGSLMALDLEKRISRSYFDSRLTSLLEVLEGSLRGMQPPGAAVTATALSTAAPTAAAQLSATRFLYALWNEKAGKWLSTAGPLSVTVQFSEALFFTPDALLEYMAGNRVAGFEVYRFGREGLKVSFETVTAINLTGEEQKRRLN